MTQFGHEDPARENREIQESLSTETTGASDRLFQRKYLKPLLLVCMIAAFNQLDGINAVLYYTADIFRMAGADKTSALLQSVIIGLTNLVMTFGGMVLIDRVGRKALLLVGSVTFIISHLLAAWVFATHTQGWIVIVAMMGRFAQLFARGGRVGENQRTAAERRPRLGFGGRVHADVGFVRRDQLGVSDHRQGFRLNSVRIFRADDGGSIYSGRQILPETKGVSLEELQKRLGLGTPEKHEPAS